MAIPRNLFDEPLITKAKPTTPFEAVGDIARFGYQNVVKPLAQRIGRGLEESFAPGNIQETALNFGPQGIAATTRKAAPKVFEGFKDLTTKTLEKLKGRSTLSRQYISDLSNAPDLKQAERDIIRAKLPQEKEVSVPRFAKSVKDELLPLEGVTGAGQYESISLPQEVRGPVASYYERAYQSPIKTSAGGVHFANDDLPNYFAHTRIEDLPNPKDIPTGAISVRKLSNTQGDTRRVIEIQSDLFQKGRLEGEAQPDIYKMNDERITDYLESKFGQKYWEKKSDFQSLGDTRRWLEKNNPKLLAEVEDMGNRQAELLKLEPYRNTWHERIIREEVKQAAVDGKTKLQFPTGETAMKIEGLGQATNDWRRFDFNTQSYATKLTADTLKVGETVQDMRNQRGIGDWIITDVLGDGKFKAVPKREVELQLRNHEPLYQEYVAKSRVPEQTDALDNFLFDLKNKNVSIESMDAFEGMTEQFDISGKVDTNNPIYRFYEKEVGKYLINKYGAKIVTDPQGVRWFEVDVPKDKANAPIEAFAAAPFFDKIIPASRETVYNPLYYDEQGNPKPPPKGYVGGYDITDYATNPQHEKIVTSIYQGLSQGVDLDEHIATKFPKANVNAKMIERAAEKYGVDKYMLAAILQADSGFGSFGLAVKTRNAGNYGNTDSGKTLTFRKWEHGVNAVAKWLKDHEVSPLSLAGNR